MPLPVFKTAEEVPEAFRSEYEQVGDEWRPKATSNDDLDKTKTALEREREKARAEEKARKAAEKERDELRRAKEAEDNNVGAETLKRWQKERDDAEKAHEEEVSAWKKKFEKVSLTDRVRAMALEKGIMADRIKKAMKDLDGRIKLADDGETMQVYDEDGKLTNESAEDFLSKTYKKEAPMFYAGSNASGSGAEGSNGSGGGTLVSPKDSLEQKRSELQGAL